MKFNHLAAICLLASLPGLAAADFLSFAIGGGVWNETPEGGIYKEGDATAVDVKDNLFWKEESQGYLFAKLEHPVPILPNVRLMYLKLDHAGNGDTSFVFEGQAYGPVSVANEFSIEQTDVTAYWEVLDNLVSLDLGLNVRLLDITYKISDPINSTSGSVSAPVPMLYGLVGASPWPGLLLSAEANYMTVAGSTISDVTAKIAYTTSFFVGIEAGYRTQTIELDDVDDTNAKIDFNGPFIGAYLKF